MKAKPRTMQLCNVHARIRRSRNLLIMLRAGQRKSSGSKQSMRKAPITNSRSGCGRTSHLERLKQSLQPQRNLIISTRTWLNNTGSVCSWCQTLCKRPRRSQRKSNSFVQGCRRFREIERLSNIQFRICLGTTSPSIPSARSKQSSNRNDSWKWRSS